MQIPDAVFMNGCTHHTDGRTLLACESATGRVLAVDQRERRLQAWITDDRLRPESAQTPGANGIKPRDGWVWISVTDRNLVLRAPGDETALYVTTNGGLWAPYQGEVQDARLLRLEVGEAGQPR